MDGETIIKDIKLTYHNAGGVDEVPPFDFPWRLEAIFSPPEFMQVAFICLYGGSEIIRVCGKSKEALEEFVKLNNLNTHPRLRKLEIWNIEDGKANQ